MAGRRAAAGWRALLKVSQTLVPGLMLGTGVLLCVAAQARGGVEAASATANGVIVKLHDAALNAPQGADPRSRSLPDASRWVQVLRAGRLDSDARVLAPDLHQPPTLRPVGRAAQLMQLGRRLSADEAQALVARLASNPQVEWVVPNTREQRMQAAPNPPVDPLYGGVDQQWWLQAAGGIDALAIEGRLRGVPGFQSAWMQHRGNAVVAVLDTGMTPHEELVGKLLPGYDFVSDWDAVAGRGYANDGDGRDADPSDPGDGVTAADKVADVARYGDCAVRPSSWHGTTIAGMLAGLTNNGVGVAAMQWEGRVVPVRVAGKCGADLADVIDGMRWAAGLPVAGVPINANPARIINMSFGGNAACNAAYADAISEIALAPGGGAVLMAAAGNTHGALARPANCAGAIGVVALNRDGFKANYSSFGAAAAVATVGGDDADGAWGDLLADTGLLSIGNTGEQAPGTAKFTRVYGTSFSAPVASGVVALMVSVNPLLSAAQLQAGLRLSARPHVSSPSLTACSDSNPGRCACTTLTCGAGVLDADQAVLYARDPAAYVKPATQAAVLNNAELQEAATRGPDRVPNVIAEPVPPVPAASEASVSGGAMSLVWGLGLLWVTLMLMAVRRRRSVALRRR
jgi:serine protease